MDSWSYGTSLFLPNGTSLLPPDSFSENPRSISGFQHGLSYEFDKDHVNGFSAVSITKVVSSSSSCVVPSSLLHLEENQFSIDYGSYDGGGTSSSGTKKPRASSLCSENPLCQVYGCNMDLSSSKDYHKRHRVCEAHSKTSVVIVNGTEQRFCQQCSRFHFLSEFDNGKRSCRRRLAGHNERRRKPSFCFLPGKQQRHKLLPQGRLVSFKDEPAISTCAHSLLSAQSQQQHLSETPNTSFSITQPNQSLSHSTIGYHQMQPPLRTDSSKTKPSSSSTVDLLQLSSHLKRIEQQQRNFTNDVKQEYNNELYFSL